MTLRRWMHGDEESDGFGPAETQVRAELEKLGWNPLTPPGALATAAVRACLLAETLDRSQNAAALPALDRQLANIMTEARTAAEPDETGLSDDGDPEEVSEFERERQRRRPPAANE